MEHVWMPKLLMRGMLSWLTSGSTTTALGARTSCTTRPLPLPIHFNPYQSSCYADDHPHEHAAVKFSSQDLEGNRNQPIPHEVPGLSRTAKALTECKYLINNYS